MISGKAIDNRCNDRLSVAHSPVTNLPQINSDNDNSVGVCRLEARVRALIGDANERLRVYTRRTTKPVSLRKQQTVQCDGIAAVLRPIRRTLLYPARTQPETLRARISAGLNAVASPSSREERSRRRYPALFPLFTLPCIRSNYVYKALLPTTIFRQFLWKQNMRDKKNAMTCFTFFLKYRFRSSYYYFV